MTEQKKPPTLQELLASSRYERELYGSTFGSVSPVLRIEPRKTFSELMFPSKGAEIARELSRITGPYAIIDAEHNEVRVVNPQTQEN